MTRFTNDDRFHQRCLALFSRVADEYPRDCEDAIEAQQTVLDSDPDHAGWRVVHVLYGG